MTDTETLKIAMQIALDQYRKLSKHWHDKQKRPWFIQESIDMHREEAARISRQLSRGRHRP